MASANVMELVESALVKKDDIFLRQIHRDLSIKIQSCVSVTPGELQAQIGKDLRRDLDAEAYIPEYAHTGKKHCVALRSEASGNCLYSSASLVLVGNNSLAVELRVLTSIELYLRADYYCDHPYFSSAHGKHGEKVCKDLKNILPMFVSMEALDSDFSRDELVKQEAILNCHDKTWSSFLCILALASVINRNIYCYYPDFGEQRYNLFFNCKIEPCPPSNASSDLHILFCFHGTVKSGEPFKHNHFAPLIYHDETASREKRKLQTVSSDIDTLSCKPKPKKSCSTKIMVQSKLSFSPSISTPALLQTPPKMSTMSMHATDLLSSQKISSAPNLPSTSTSTSSISATHEYDVAHYREKARTMNDVEIYNLIKNVFIPDKNYSFPRRNGRRFCHAWFSRYSWLCYSPSLDGAFCLPCVLFGDRHPDVVNATGIKNLYSAPYTYWNDMTRYCNNHIGFGKTSTSNVSLHERTSDDFTTLLDQLTGKAQPIDVMISENRRKKISKNRRKLIPIVDTIITCGRLGLSFRGHRDDSRYHPEVGSYSKGGVGNFVELLNMRVRAGDVGLEEHLKTCPKNASYISKTTQNEIIKCCGQVITEKIIQEVKLNKFYSIIADEAADCSNKEQLSLVLRFVDSSLNIREDFIKFIHCKWGLSGADLAAVILKAIADLSLNIEDCRGQGYDGAGAVSGHINGLSAHILRINKKAIYTHCYSHRLNLVICATCSVPLVRNVMTKVSELSSFFNNSQNRQMLFEKNVLQYSPDIKKKKLKDVCRTRWVERVDGLDVFEELFVPIFHTLSEMSSNLERQCNPSTSSQATSYFALISSFQFIVSLVITRNILDMTLPVTQLLQAKNNDILDGIGLIQALKNVAMTARNEIDHYHDQWYDQAVSLAAEVGIEQSFPRTACRQTTRDNPPASDAREYFKRAITIPVLDHLNSDLKTRFDDSSLICIYGLSIIPSKMISLVGLNNDSSWMQTFKKFSSFYEDDFPNALALDAELQLWQTYWLNYQGLHPSSVASTLKAVSFDSFQNIKVGLRILATLPVTSCECERSFSAMRRLKNYTRSTMVEDRLNGLALMEIHQEIEPDVQEVINIFSADRRRIELV